MGPVVSDIPGRSYSKKTAQLQRLSRILLCIKQILISYFAGSQYRSACQTLQASPELLLLTCNNRVHTGKIV